MIYLIKNRNSTIIGFILFFLLQSCVSSHVFEDAQTIGKGNRSIEGSLARALFTPDSPNPDDLTRFYNSRDIGTARVEYVYGLTDRIDISGGLDIPVGLHGKFKWLMAERKLRHLHSLKTDVYIPLAYFLSDDRTRPLFAFSPTYVYSYRYDELFSLSGNASVLTVIGQNEWTSIPGIAGGIHIGDEVRFTLGVSYFNNFKLFDSGQIQYISVEASIKYDL